ncbi:hypothetical protein cyc_01606 [Cyclospora cayetanensis]|uniref:Uncharacterized protein n=1 Tax=Cyclospora cayetanensis TaxID=88456 RepID=A0A1D3D938_9EIME|nr:hypothetical protein cyc_01606 [Cyclospora cayetanensis]
MLVAASLGVITATFVVGTTTETYHSWSDATENGATGILTVEPNEDLDFNYSGLDGALNPAENHPAGLLHGHNAPASKESLWFRGDNLVVSPVPVNLPHNGAQSGQHFPDIRPGIPFSPPGASAQHERPLEHKGSSLSPSDDQEITIVIHNTHQESTVKPSSVTIHGLRTALLLSILLYCVSGFPVLIGVLFLSFATLLLLAGARYFVRSLTIKPEGKLRTRSPTVVVMRAKGGAMPDLNLRRLMKN